MPRAKPTMAEDVDVTSVLRNLKKWLNTQDIDTKLDITGKDISIGLHYGILFLDYLRNNYPDNLTASEVSLVKVVADLHAKMDSKSDTPSNGKPLRTKNATKQEDTSKAKVKVLPGKDQQPKDIDNARKPGPKQDKKKLSPISVAMEKLNIQESKGCGCKGECKTKVCGCQKRNAKCTASCKCSDKCVNKDLKSVSKPDPAKKDASQDSSDEGSEDILEEGSEDSLEEGSEDEQESNPENNLFSRSSPASYDKQGSDEDLDKENVDWNKHMSALVQCRKCKRNFFASRVEYHSQVCKMSYQKMSNRPIF